MYHPAQAEIHRGLKRFNVLSCGRRFGKDVMERNYACEGMLAAEPVAWYEPDYKSLLENWAWFGKTLFPIIKRKSEVEHRIDLLNGGYLEMWSLQDKDASRGRHYGRVVINEAAKVPALDYSWNAVIRVTLADLRGKAMIGSTPKGHDYFWNMYRKGEDKLEPEWACFHKTTWDNPYIPRDELEKMKNEMVDIIYQQEVMGEFVDLSGAVFRRVGDAAILQPLEKPQAGHQYVCGVDVASSVDFTVACVLDVSTHEMVYMDRFNRVDYNVLVDRLAALYQTWNLDLMKIEANSIGQPVIDMLVNLKLNIIPFTTSNATKQVIIQQLQAAFENVDIKIINDSILVGELLSFEAKRNNSGSFSYAAPEGLHDDAVMSLAFAWDCIANRPWLIS
jgi:6-pyruvoyl-tetrahydropterin synthase